MCIRSTSFLCAVTGKEIVRNGKRDYNTVDKTQGWVQFPTGGKTPRAERYDPV